MRCGRAERGEAPSGKSGRRRRGMLDQAAEDLRWRMVLVAARMLVDGVSRRKIARVIAGILDGRVRWVVSRSGKLGGKV